MRSLAGGIPADRRSGAATTTGPAVRAVRRGVDAALSAERLTVLAGADAPRAPHSFGTARGAVAAMLGIAPGVDTRARTRARARGARSAAHALIAHGGDAIAVRAAGAAMERVGDRADARRSAALLPVRAAASPCRADLSVRTHDPATGAVQRIGEGVDTGTAARKEPGPAARQARRVDARRADLRAGVEPRRLPGEVEGEITTAVPGGERHDHGKHEPA